MQILEDTLRAIYNGALEADDFTPKGLFIYKHNKTFKITFSDINHTKGQFDVLIT